MASPAQVQAWRRQLAREQQHLAVTQRRITRLQGKIADAERKQARS